MKTPGGAHKAEDEQCPGKDGLIKAVKLGRKSQRGRLMGRAERAKAEHMLFSNDLNHTHIIHLLVCMHQRLASKSR